MILRHLLCTTVTAAAARPRWYARLYQSAFEIGEYGNSLGPAGVRDLEQLSQVERGRTEAVQKQKVLGEML